MSKTFWATMSSDAPDAVEIRVFDYEAQVVKQWIRGIMDIRQPSGDPAYERFMDEMDVFLGKWMAGSDEDVAMGIAHGRRLLIQLGEIPHQLVPTSRRHRRFR